VDALRMEDRIIISPGTRLAGRVLPDIQKNVHHCQVSLLSSSEDRLLHRHLLRLRRLHPLHRPQRPPQPILRCLSTGKERGIPEVSETWQDSEGRPGNSTATSSILDWRLLPSRCKVRGVGWLLLRHLRRLRQRQDRRYPNSMLKRSCWLHLLLPYLGHLN